MKERIDNMHYSKTGKTITVCFSEEEAQGLTIELAEHVKESKPLITELFLNLELNEE